MGTWVIYRLLLYLLHADNHSKQPRGKEGGTHGEDAAVLSLPALARGMGPRIANRRIFGFHPPTTLLDRYLPLATEPGHPYPVTHDDYVVLLYTAALFFLAFEVKYTISPAPVKLPMPTIRLTILPKNGDGKPWLTGAGDGAGQASNHPKSEQDKLQDLPWEDCAAVKGGRSGRNDRS